MSRTPRDLSKKEPGDIEDVNNNNRGKGGLGTEIHPLLKGIVAPSAHRNPVKRTHPRDQFDPLLLNPYLDQTSGPSRKRKPLEFSPHGKYIAQGEKLRENLLQARRTQSMLESKRANGLLPDQTLGEDRFKFEAPPSIEWWDSPYLKKSYYSDDPHDLVLDAETNPISIYVQHPLISKPIWDKLHQQGDQTLILTPQERKRIRRNERQLKLKQQQDRIKLGLEPPPPPKVKLANLMSVLTNEAIKDPTGVEMKVREQVQHRLETHLQANEARKLAKLDRATKMQRKHEQDLARGLYSTVYRIDRVSPQHQFKIDINAKQLDLCGLCILNPKFCLVVVVGGEKAIKFFRKLMMQRIKWDEYLPRESNSTDGKEVLVDTPAGNTKTEDGNPPDGPKLGNASPGLSTEWADNKCLIVWDGIAPDAPFKKWSVIGTNDDEDVSGLVLRFGLENYWRQALVD